MSTLSSAIAQWHSNRRLRLFAALAILVLTANVAATMGDSRAARIEAYQSDRALLARLEGAAADDAWSQRASDAVDALTALEGTMVGVTSPGQAQAELQALLAAAAASAGLVDAAVRTESAAPVDGLPGVWEVSARLAASASGEAATALLTDIEGRPFIRVDRVDVRDASPGQVQIIARAYFREDAQEAAP
jgi:hypothetical protein